MSEVKELHIRCIKCNEWINIPILFSDFVSLITSKLEGEQVECLHCGEKTGCNKENMQFRAKDAGFVGKDTL
jgi:hypothetical protein